MEWLAQAAGNSEYLPIDDDEEEGFRSNSGGSDEATGGANPGASSPLPEGLFDRNPCSSLPNYTNEGGVASGRSTFDPALPRPCAASPRPPPLS